MKIINHKQILLSNNSFYPCSLVGEMFLGVVVSIAIGIGFSILAAMLILILAGGEHFDPNPAGSSIINSINLANAVQSSPRFMVVTRNNH